MRFFQRFLVVVSLIAGLPAAAQSALQLQQQLKSGEGAKQPLPVHLNASLTQNVGSGTFVASPFNPTVSTQLTLNPLISYQGFSFALNQSFALEYTQSDYTTTPNQVEMADTALLARYGKLGLPDLGLAFIPTLSYIAPLSLTSRQAGSLGTTGASLRTIWNVSSINSSFYLNGATAFTFLSPAMSARFNNGEVRPFTDSTGKSAAALGCITRNPQELLSYGCGDIPSFARWSTGVGGSWNGFDGALSVNVDLAYGQAFSAYYGPDDELRANNAITGYGLRQSTSGNVSATYIPLGWLYLTLGFSSFQPAFTADGKTPRFPFWDFLSPYNNNSGIYFDTTISI